MAMLNNQMVDSLLGIWHQNWGPSHWWQEASGSISVDSRCFGYETARIGYLQISATRACCWIPTLPGGRQNAIPLEPSRSIIQVSGIPTPFTDSVANAVKHNATNCFLSPFIQLYQKHSCAPISWGQNLDRCLCHHCPQGGLGEIAMDQGLTKILSGWWFGTWLDYFPYVGNNHPNWLSYFSEG